MRITYELLKKHGACQEQRDEFRRLFPVGCSPSVGNLTFLANHGYGDADDEYCEPCKCHHKSLDVIWLRRLLPEEIEKALDARTYSSTKGWVDLEEEIAQLSVCLLSVR
jgi:hypothetical protein